MSPGNGTQLTSVDEIVLTWALDPGTEFTCVEVTKRPETAWAGGPFLDADLSVGDCDYEFGNGAPQQTSARFGLYDYDYMEVNYGTFYWHVQTRHQVCTPSPNSGIDGHPEPDVCKYEFSWGPIASFANVKPPKPVKPVSVKPTPTEAKPDYPHLRGYRFCGWRKFNRRNSNIWTFKGPAPGVFTAMFAKGLSCHIARRNYAKITYGTKAPYRVRVGGYRCKTMHKRWEYNDIRCAKKGRHGVAFRYQAGV